MPNYLEFDSMDLDKISKYAPPFSYSFEVFFSSFCLQKVYMLLLLNLDNIQRTGLFSIKKCYNKIFNK